MPAKINRLFGNNLVLGTATTKITDDIRLPFESVAFDGSTFKAHNQQFVSLGDIAPQLILKLELSL